MNKYNLESRLFNFSKEIRVFVINLEKRFYNIDDCKQLIRSSGSIGANYIEANGSLGQKDFIMRIRIAKKEANETLYWLKLLKSTNPNNDSAENLITETTEIIKILGSILTKSLTK